MRIITEPESERLEFKRSEKGRIPENTWQTICAFSNTDGGKILHGPGGNGWHPVFGAGTQAIYVVNRAGVSNGVNVTTSVPSVTLAAGVTWDFNRDLNPYEEERVSLLTLENTATALAGFSTFTVSASWNWSVRWQGIHNHSMSVALMGWNSGGWFTSEWTPGQFWGRYENGGGSYSGTFSLPVSTILTQPKVNLIAWRRRANSDEATQMRFWGTIHSVVLTA